MGGGSGGIAQCFMIGVLISKFNYLIEFSKYICSLIEKAVFVGTKSATNGTT